MPATDDELLLIRIEGRLTQFEKTLAQATGGADRAARRIETRFRTMERNLSSIGAGIGRSLLGPLTALLSARALGGAANAFNRIENALKVTGIQGEELGRTFQHLSSIATRNGAPVEALAELYSRLSITQKELGVNSDEIIRFTEGVAAALRVSGRSAEESRGALLQLSQAMGSGIVRAEEFNAILEGALPIAQAAARGLEEAGGSVAKLRTLIIDGKVSSEAFFRAFQAGQADLEALAATTELTLAQAFTNLQTEVIGAVGRLDELAGITPAVAAGLNNISAAIGGLVSLIEQLNSTDPPSWFPAWLIRGTQIGGGPSSSETNPLLGPAMDAMAAKESLDALADAKDRLKEGSSQITTDDILSPEASKEAVAAALRIQQAFQDAGFGNTVSLGDFNKPGKTAGARGGGRRTPEGQFAEDIARIRERTALLNLETAAVGKSTFEAERMLAVQNLLNEAKRAGVEITPELTAQIEAEASAYAAAVEQLDATEERYRGLQEAQSFFAETAFDAFRDLIPIIETGNAALDRMLSTLIEAALQAALLGQGPLAALLGGGATRGGGGFLGKLFSGFFASGGTLGAGRWGIAGENGPEPIVGPARVIPNGWGSGRQMVETSVRVEPSPLFIATVDSRVRSMGSQVLRATPGAVSDKQRRYA